MSTFAASTWPTSLSDARRRSSDSARQHGHRLAVEAGDPVARRPAPGRVGGRAAQRPRPSVVASCTALPSWRVTRPGVAPGCSASRSAQRSFHP